MSKLSIITINYNNLEGLKRTIESVRNQTWQEFEYIVIDGGSIDGSAAYIENQNEYIDYWVSEPDNGIYNAMNKGIAKATGEYLLFLNSGDHFYSDASLNDNQNKIINYDLIYFDIELIDKKKSRIVSYPEKLTFYFFYLETLCHQSTFIKKELFETIGYYDENLKIVSDWKFFIIALFRCNCSYMKVNSIITTYYLDGMSSDLANKNCLNEEKEEVLNFEFKNLVDDFKEFRELRKKVSNLRKSRKISLLIKLNLLGKF